MSVYYDTNIPSYNKFRYRVPSSVDTLNRVSIVFTNVPAELTEYILSGLATAIDVNAWRGDYADRQAIVDLFNEVVVTYDICDLVADCIANDASVQQAINNYAGANLSRMESGAASDATAVASSSPSYNTPLLTGDCDDDVLFGQVTGIVDLANTLIMDLWARFELATTGLERSATFASAIPAIGLLPADEVIAFADNELQNLFQGYEGAYTAQLRDEYRCDLYCIALDNGCQLTVADAAEYFRKRAGADILDGLTFSEMFLYFFTGTFGGGLISHASHYLLFAVLAFSARFLNFDSFYYSTAVKAFANDPDPDWAIICDPCPPSSDYCVSFDFTGSASNGFAIVDNQGAFGVDGVNGAVGAGSGSPAVVANMDRVFASSFTGIDNVQVTYSCEDRSLSDSSLLVTSTQGNFVDVTVPGKGDDVVISVTLPGVTASDIQVIFDTGLTPAGGGQVTIKNITISGKGASPIASNC